MKSTDKEIANYIIDRFEGTYAICEDKSKDMVRIPKYQLPPECKEGDTIVKDPAGYYRIDAEATKKDEERIKDKLSRLFEHK